METQEQAVLPPEQAEVGSPLNGVVPPKDKRWKPGQSGNPKGRRLSDAIDAKLAQEKRADILVEAMFQKVEQKWDVAAFKEIIERHEGKVPTTIDARTENYFFIEEVGRDWDGEDNSP